MNILLIERESTRPLVDYIENKNYTINDKKKFLKVLVEKGFLSFIKKPNSYEKFIEEMDEKTGVEIKEIFEKVSSELFNKYTELSKEIRSGINFMELVLNRHSNHDLIVFPNNMALFKAEAFRERYNSNIEELLNKEILLHLNVVNKKPFVLGIDIEPINGINPHKGINSIVAFIDVEGEGKNAKYVLGCYIWECWHPNEKVLKESKKYFVQKNGKNNRYFSIKAFPNIKIGLLSCGDSKSTCHSRGELLENTDILLNLLHTGMRRKFKLKYLIDEGKTNLFLTTVNLSRETLRKKDFKDNHYGKNKKWEEKKYSGYNTIEVTYTK